jgi:hypothetical protein
MTSGRAVDHERGRLFSHRKLLLPRLQHHLQTQLGLTIDDVRCVIERNPQAALTR